MSVSHPDYADHFEPGGVLRLARQGGGVVALCALLLAQQSVLQGHGYLAGDRFDLGEIEELSTGREETSWWSFLPTAAGKATMVRSPAICAGIGAEVA